VGGEGGAGETVRGTLGLWGRVPLASPARAAGPMLVPCSSRTLGLAGHRLCCSGGCRAAGPTTVLDLDVDLDRDLDVDLGLDFDLRVGPEGLKGWGVRGET